MKFLNRFFGARKFGFSQCAFCGAETEDPARFPGDESFCPHCVAKISKVRVRRKEEPPPGANVEYVFPVGFDRMPTQSDVNAFGSLDKEVRGSHLHTLMLSGGLPKSGKEAGMIAVNLIMSNGRERLWHEIDWGKVTYEGFQDFLVVKFWR